MSFKRYCPRPYSAIQPFHNVTTGGGFDGPGEVTTVADGSPVPVKAREISSEEAQRAGLTLTTTTYFMWADIGAEHVVENQTVKFPAGSEDTHKIKSVVEYPERKIAKLTVERTA